MRLLEGKNIVLGVTGGIAAYKSAYLAREMMRAGASVSTVLTTSAARFITPLTFESLTERPCRTDDDMFAGTRGQTHISLARGLDLIVIAPASATTLARLASGLADNMLSATVLAASCPIVVSPAMHTNMWLSTPVQRNVETLRGFPGYLIVPPDDGNLASGDVGPGRFPSIERILHYCAAALTPQSLRGRTVVVTGGPTREHIDPVRVITNPSSGRMGIALAEAAARRGAAVRLVLGPCDATFDSSLPGGPHQVIRVETTVDMMAAVEYAVQGADGLVMAAAPADERPAVTSEIKIAKDGFGTGIATTPNPDILATLAPLTGALAVMAFAAETDVSADAAAAKMARKGADLLFANRAGGGRGFGDVPDGGILVRADGTGPVQIAEMPKPELAEVLVDELVQVIKRKRG